MAATGDWAPESDDERRVFERVAAIIEEIRPFIRMDGGDISLAGVRNGVVRVRMHGACAGCAGAVMTLRNGIERRLRAEVPGVKVVESV
jgi:Fe-S cluster biogenesis protein NfuA